MHAVLLVVEGLEYRHELWDDEDIEDHLVRLQDLDDPTLLDGPLVASHQLPDAGAVHEGHFVEIDQEVLLSLVQKMLDHLPHLQVARPVGHATLEIDDADVTARANIRDH